MDLGGTPSRMVVSGVLRLDNVVDTFTAGAGAEVEVEVEVEVESLELLEGSTTVLATGTGSLLEITGDQQSIWGKPAVLGQDVVATGLAADHTLVPQVVGNDLELVIPEPGPFASGVAALASLLLIDARARRRRDQQKR